jgi:hypothetical protein
MGPISALAIYGSTVRHDLAKGDLVVRTYYDMEVDPDDVWRALRRSRQAPPGAASETYTGNMNPTGGLTAEGAARVGTYRAALEQAEELMKAAAATGPAAKPLPLFYALSQFGRAIAAAAPALETENREFRLSGHGLKTASLDGVDRGGLASLRVRGLANGSFPSVAKALHASAMPLESTIGQVLGWVPFSSRFALQGTLPASSILELRPMYPPSEEVQWVTVTGVPFEVLADTPTPNNGEGALPRSFLPDDAVIADLFDRYPALAGWTWSNPTPVASSVRPGQTGGWDVTLRLPAPGDSDRVLRRCSIYYRGGNYAYPSISDGLTIHPFLAWWQTLFSLSMLARYQPNEWLQLIDINSHPDAVPIESILTFCENAGPELALRAIEDAADVALLPS